MKCLILLFALFFSNVSYAALIYYTDCNQYQYSSIESLCTNKGSGIVPGGATGISPLSCVNNAGAVYCDVWVTGTCPDGSSPPASGVCAVVCVLPQILNAVTNSCITPPLVCTLPQILDAVTNTCITLPLDPCAGHPIVTQTFPVSLTGMSAPNTIQQSCGTLKHLGDIDCVANAAGTFCSASYGPADSTVGNPAPPSNSQAGAAAGALAFSVSAAATQGLAAANAASVAASVSASGGASASVAASAGAAAAVAVVAAAAASLTTVGTPAAAQAAAEAAAAAQAAGATAAAQAAAGVAAAAAQVAAAAAGQNAAAQAVAAAAAGAAAAKAAVTAAAVSTAAGLAAGNAATAAAIANGLLGDIASGVGGTNGLLDQLLSKNEISDFCIAHPDSGMCAIGSGAASGVDSGGNLEQPPDRNEIGTNSISVGVYVPVLFAAPAGCPASLSYTMLGHVYELSFDTICNVMSQIRPIVVSLATLTASIIFVGAFL